MELGRFEKIGFDKRCHGKVCHCLHSSITLKGVGKLNKAINI